jgi:serine/threonine protein kinase
MTVPLNQDLNQGLTELAAAEEGFDITTIRLCPKCERPSAITQLTQADYRCIHCGFELAHIDFSPTGAVRGIFGWLRAVDDIIHDRYRVKTVLGKGGFAATYLVDDLRLNGKKRALKEVPEALFDEYETGILSQLDHPSIPDITDRLIADGMIYLVLEFGGSRTLDSKRKRRGGQIPLELLLPWMRQLCEVLTYLHARTPPIVHRDLKPGNILLDDNDRIMLIDFGIAKESKVSEETRTLARAASHGFSPPEQVMGTGTDPRSDIYALAATFYALLTGTIPPAAHERIAGKEVVPTSQLIKGVPETVDKAILQALDLNANRRPQTAQTFSRMLDGGQDSGSGSRSPGPDKTERRQADSSLSPKGSIKLPSVDLRAAGSKKPSGGEEAGKHKQWILPIALIPVLLAAVGGGAYYFWPETSDPEPPIKDESASIEKIEKTGEEKRPLQQGTDETIAKKNSMSKVEQLSPPNTNLDAPHQPPITKNGGLSVEKMMEERRLRQEAAEPAIPTFLEEPPAPPPIIKKNARKREDQSKQRTAQRDNRSSQRRSQKSESSSQAKKSESQGAGSWGPMIDKRSYKTD